MRCLVDMVSSSFSLFACFFLCVCFIHHTRPFILFSNYLCFFVVHHLLYVFALIFFSFAAVSEYRSCTCGPPPPSHSCMIDRMIVIDLCSDYEYVTRVDDSH